MNQSSPLPKVPSSKFKVPRPSEVSSFQAERHLFLRRPGFKTYYAIGVVYLKRAAAFASYAEVGKALGVTKQTAYTECVVALGKLLYHLVHSVQGGL